MELTGKEPIAIIDAPYSKFVSKLKKALKDEGLWVKQSFNLQSIQNFNDSNLNRSHTNRCACNLVIYLVYQNKGDPITLILDERFKKTYIYLSNEHEFAREALMLAAISNAIHKVENILRPDEP